eukprot:5281215-Pyramimonas_sp.AAC.1
MVFPRGNHTDHLSIYLDVPDSERLEKGWSRHAAFQLSVLNQKDPSKTIKKGANRNQVRVPQHRVRVPQHRVRVP